MCKDSTKIAFVIAYGNQYGLGHYVRMNTLADVFVKYNCICEFITDINTDLRNYDIVIIDTYWVTDEFIANTNKFTVCYDDNALYCYSCNVLINANFYAEELNLRFGKVIIDELPLDYSILDEIDYHYPTENAYFGYMTRGCVNHCAFC
ncbi:MAG: hypothetical protein LBM93_09905, partial [Oscillospiraceae bacterium]|nr:hypothetical protein [Oscillospiraceae bacterium]